MGAPTTSLRFSDHEAFAQIAAELYRRSGFGGTESGCFVLGRISRAERTAEDVIYFDDIDPDAYHAGAIRLNTAKLSTVYDICEAKGLSVVGDIHVHPLAAFLSTIDEAYPVIAREGHVSVILPYDGRYRVPRQIAINIYRSTGQWIELPRGKCSKFLGIDRATPKKASFDRTELLLARKGVRSSNRGSLLEGIRVGILADDRTCTSAQGQAAILTAVALCSRFARGGVMVRLGADATLYAMPSALLSDEVQRLGGEAWTKQTENSIVLGDVDPKTGGFTVRPWSYDGAYGCSSIRSGVGIEDDYVPGTIAAAALAVGEIFRYRVLGKTEVAPRDRNMRLWTASERASLPRDFSTVVKAVWLLGFGHLGNAFAWTIAHTPTLRPRLYVQDPQAVDVANASTQLFAVPADVGTMKVRVAERELNRYGVSVEADPTAIDDRYVPAEYPDIVLGGLDHVAPRRALSRADVSLIVDAGLGSTETTFAQYRINTIADPGAVIDLFQEATETSDLQGTVTTEAFAEMDDGSPETHCGLMALADTDVAVPFVGTVVATLALTQLARHSLGLETTELVSGDVLEDLSSVV